MLYWIEKGYITIRNMQPVGAAMSERYKKRYYLTRRLYASGAPVLIESGTLLYDAQSNACLCQLVFRNIQDKPIKSLRAVVQCLDGRFELMDRAVDHRYQDLELNREDEIGRDSAIVLPTPDARSFTVRVAQVCFADGEVWTDEDVSWETLPEPPELAEYCCGERQAEKFRRHYGENCRETPLFTGELWFCTCGAVNRNEESRCHRCRSRKSDLMRWCPVLPRGDGAFDPEEGDAPPRLFFPPLFKRLVTIAAGLVLLVGLALALYLNRASLLALTRKTQTAEPSSVETQDTPEDEEADAQAQKYEDASALLEAGSYSQAREAFLDLGDYQDSRELACEAVYRKAQALTAFINGHDVAGIRAAVSCDPEEESLFYLPRDLALDLDAQGVGDLQSACGQDAFRFVTEEEADGTLPILEDAVAELYASLGDYKDSARLAKELPEQADRSFEFFELCARGELPQAQEWLLAHPEDFEGREAWAERVDRFLPFCRDWVSVSGDLSLLPRLQGLEEECSQLRCVVLLEEDRAVLRFLLHEGDSEGPELIAEGDEERFYFVDEEITYMAVLTSFGNLSVAKYNPVFVISGVDYTGA